MKATQSDVILSLGSRATPFFTVAASALGATGAPTPRFSPLIPLCGRDGRVPTQVRIHGRLIAPTAGGSLSVRACLVHGGVRPATGAAAGNTLVQKLAGQGADSDGPALATTTAASFSVVCHLNAHSTDQSDVTDVAARHLSLRASNESATAYTGGTVSIDRVELLD